MIYCQTVISEKIAVHPMDDTNDTQFVELIKYGSEPTFVVCIEDCNDEWYWEFDMTVPSNYERIKLTIFDMIHECGTMNELACVLDEIFHEGFSSIMIDDE